MTLRELVDISRRNKAAELAAATARLAGSPHPPGAPAGRPPARGGASGGLPRLWSLTAAGGHWRAEVLLDGRLHVVDTSSGPSARLGPWRVVGLASQGLHVERIGASGMPTSHLVLSPPGRGAAASGFRFAGEPASEADTETDDAVRRAAALPMPQPQPQPMPLPIVPAPTGAAVP
ncbi:hypothetical protein CDL60_19330 [Roseateles noduli]|nr:hypothetical protein CDL60_19330 [Roseateles noduli]